MKLLTKEILAKIPKLYANDGKKPEDVKVIVKFFHPASSWTWFGTEYDPEERLFFGLVQGQEEELGYFSLDELESINVRGLGIERDKWFGFDHTLAEVMKK
jgi:hypothetical protein